MAEKKADSSSDQPKSKANIILLVFLAGAVLLLATVLFGFLNDKGMLLNGKKFNVITAQTPAEREKGLGGWEKLGDRQGMLFIFSDPSQYCFWMKDMKFNIDMIWLDANKKVVSTKTDAMPESYPESFCPDKDAKYVLEVKAGTVQQLNIKAGDQAKF